LQLLNNKIKIKIFKLLIILKIINYKLLYFLLKLLINKMNKSKWLDKVI